MHCPKPQSPIAKNHGIRDAFFHQKDFAMAFPENETGLHWIEPGHALYNDERDLRFRILRAPLGMPRGSEVVAHEAETWHLVALQNNTVIGCVLFHPPCRQNIWAIITNGSQPTVPRPGHRQTVGP